jgi:hypothetical protein
MLVLQALPMEVLILATLAVPLVLVYLVYTLVRAFEAR